MIDEWINLDTGCLHRADCHTAVHIIQNQTKMHYRVGRTLEGRDISGPLPHKQSHRYAPIGTGVGYLSKCRVCKPVGDERKEKPSPWCAGPGETWKTAGDLRSSDVGRESEYGFIECIEHGRQRTVIALHDGTLQYLHPNERLGLFFNDDDES